MQWYYVSPTQEKFAAEERELPALIRSGVLRPQSLLWHPGRPEWTAAGEVVPELFGAAGVEAGADPATPLARLSLEPLLRSRGWLVVVSLALAALVAADGAAAVRLLETDAIMAAGALVRNLFLLVLGLLLLTWWWRLRRAARSSAWEDFRASSRAGARVLLVLGLLAVLYLLAGLYRLLGLAVQTFFDL